MSRCNATNKKDKALLGSPIFACIRETRKNTYANDIRLQIWFNSQELEFKIIVVGQTKKKYYDEVLNPKLENIPILTSGGGEVFISMWRVDRIWQGLVSRRTICEETRNG